MQSALGPTCARESVYHGLRRPVGPLEDSDGWEIHLGLVGAVRIGTEVDCQSRPSGLLTTVSMLLWITSWFKSGYQCLRYSMGSATREMTTSKMVLNRFRR